MSSAFANITVSQLHRAADIRAQIDRLHAELDTLLSGHATARRGRPGRPPGKRGTISAAGRARIAAAQRKRWAKIRAKRAKSAAGGK